MNTTLLQKAKNNKLNTDYGLKRKCNSKIQAINISLHPISTFHIEKGKTLNLKALVDREVVYEEKFEPEKEGLVIDTIVRFDLAAEFGFDKIICIGFGVNKLANVNES